MRRAEVDKAFTKAAEFAAKRYPSGGLLHDAAAYAFLKGYLGIGLPPDQIPAGLR